MSGDGGRVPSSSDEEIIYAASSAVETEHSEEERLERIDRELRRGFDALGRIGRAVCVFGSARTPPGSNEYERARSIGRALGEAGFAVITGGGPGAMEGANRGAQEAGALSVGLNIELPHEQALNRCVDVGIEFHYFFTRKLMFVRYSDAFVVLPGGYGTMDELFEALTLIQTGKAVEHPVVLEDSAFWRGLIEWLEGYPLARGMLLQADVQQAMLADGTDEVMARLRAAFERRGIDPAPDR